ncbi:hypothetical protein BOTCAL_0570g00060 [Botryotinia calthae]|uniref:Uncharacterized protein n=1 Tax=Botryotinia calthae TaxID=38488 RepID=A0A4Y8CJL9_9HELO|nr:hypothetical protein BOTCAL_0570g00060 [Botryotinia calthae]
MSFLSSGLDNALTGHQPVRIVQYDEIFSIQDHLLYTGHGPARLLNFVEIKEAALSLVLKYASCPRPPFMGITVAFHHINALAFSISI